MAWKRPPEILMVDGRVWNLVQSLTDPERHRALVDAYITAETDDGQIAARTIRATSSQYSNGEADALLQRALSLCKDHGLLVMTLMEDGGHFPMPAPWKTEF